MDSEQVKNAILKGIRYMSPYSHDTPAVGRYRGSEIGFCHRKLMLQRFFLAKKYPNLAKFQGSCFSTALPDIFRASGSELTRAAVEIPVGSRHKSPQGRDFEFFGHVDAVLPYEAFEMKLTGSVLDPNEPLPPYYFAQANTYAVELNKPQFHLVAVNRTKYGLWFSGDHVTIVTNEADRDAYNALMERVGNTHDCIVEGRLPPKEPVASWECKGCYVKDYCKLYEGVEKLDNKPLLGEHNNMMDVLTKGR